MMIFIQMLVEVAITMCFSFMVTLNNNNEWFIVSTNDTHAGFILPD